MMAKPTIFLSHINEEADLAGAFRAAIEESFLGLVDVFQSSYPKSMPIGTNWLDNITKALRDCQAILLFCSPNSVNRPWINFECGAGWGRAIEVVPVCHSGLRPVDLPIPISLLQGVEATDGPGLQQVFEMVAKKLGSRAPTIDQRALTDRAAAFSERYVTDLSVGNYVVLIKRGLDEHLFSILKKVPADTVVPIDAFPQTYFERVKPALDALQENKNLQYSWAVGGIIVDGSPYSGTRGLLTLKLSRSLHEGIQKA
ncbi:toll/interleukin-1 receptor domain-containing protein [Sphingomonas qilianensis]|uniref:Toll/interleukin-1 receptor domain-containing protein n=1 Tax=Sphingomonas qilianensis TaxID=1736690 RepID=A0ABU9XMM3_9SPHN